jgi:hypothetical protein
MAVIRDVILGLSLAVQAVAPAAVSLLRLPASYPRSPRVFVPLASCPLAASRRIPGTRRRNAYFSSAQHAHWALVARRL